MPLRGGDGGGVGYMTETVRSAWRTKGKAKVSGNSEMAKVEEVLVSLLSNPLGIFQWIQVSGEDYVQANK